MHRKKSVLDDVRELADLLKPGWSAISARIDQSGVPSCHVADPPLKEKLKKIEAEIEAKRDELATAAKVRDEAKEAFAGSEDLSQDSDEFKEAQEAVRAHGQIADDIANLQAVQIGTLKMLGKDAPAPSGDRPAGDPSDPRGGWDSSSLFADTDLRARLADIASSSERNKFGGITLGSVINRDAFAAEVSGTPDMRRSEWIGIVPQLRRMLRVLDLIPTGTMDANVLPYTVESGSFSTAKGVKDGETKAEGAITFTDAEAVARTIAHYLKIQKPSLSDYAALRSIIDSRLRYGVERKLEAEVLAGTGTDPELKGILKTSGIGVTKYVANTLTADQVLAGITAVMLADGQATGIVMYPTDWQGALSAKATTGDGHYYSGGPFVGTPQQMWGIPLVASAAMSEGDTLVGDFEIGAQLFIREGVNVLLSDSDQDDFIKNKVTLLAEMRAALAVFRPAVFNKIYLTKAAEEAG
jgi:hypothetical protein